MQSCEVPDESLDRLALELSTAWARAASDLESGRKQTQRLLQSAPDAVQVRLASLSAAWEALHGVSFLSLDPSLEGRLDALTLKVRATAWPRAQALLDAAWALRTIQTRQLMDAAFERLTFQGQADQDPRPPVERVWTDAAAAILQAEVGSFDGALRSGLAASRLADECGLDWCASLARQSLAFTFLCVGDVEGARAVLPAGIAARQRIGTWHHTVHMRYNLLLSQVLSGELDAAQAELDAQPALLGHDLMQGNPFLRCLAAYLCSLRGQHPRALELLARDEHPPEAGFDVPALAANRAWMTASVWQRAGHTARARQRLEGFMAHSAARGWHSSPLNTTQLKRVLSEVCEAEGDLHGALDALRQSQAACFQWVAGSVRIRLQAMHAQQATDADDADRLSRRLDALARATAPEAAAQPKQAARANMRFLAHVTHEMRNPLNGVIGMASLLALSDLDARQRRYLAVVESSAQMLLALCNDTLDLAKIEAGRFDINPRATNVAALLREALQLVESQVDQRQVRLQLLLADELPAVLVVDQLRLRQVLLNLLGNAAKFTRKGSIRLDARWSPTAAERGVLRVTVSDTGPGLTAGQRDRLFQEFTQGDASVAEHHGGTGLGLALCRSLIGLMGGHIDVDSEPGKGCAFWFELPLSEAAVVPNESPQDGTEPTAPART